MCQAENASRPWSFHAFKTNPLDFQRLDYVNSPESAKSKPRLRRLWIAALLFDIRAKNPKRIRLHFDLDYATGLIGDYVRALAKCIKVSRFDFQMATHRKAAGSKESLRWITERGLQSLRDCDPIGTDQRIGHKRLEVLTDLFRVYTIPTRKLHDHTITFPLQAGSSSVPRELRWSSFLDSTPGTLSRWWALTAYACASGWRTSLLADGNIRIVYHVYPQTLATTTSSYALERVPLQN